MIRRITFMDGKVLIIRDPGMITEASVGICVSSEDMQSNTLYPWHTINKLERYQENEK